MSGLVSSTSQAYSNVPPLPLAERFTVAVTLLLYGLLNVTLEAVGAVGPLDPPLTLPDTVALYCVVLLSPSIK